MPRRRDYSDKMRRNAAAEEHMLRKRMLRDWDGIREALPEVDAGFIKKTREKLKYSGALFARRLCMSEGTLEAWEQGRTKPNAQAVVLLLLVHHFPDTLDRLRRIAYPDRFRGKVIY